MSRRPVLALILALAPLSLAAGCNAPAADAPTIVTGVHDDPSAGRAPYSRSVQLGDALYLSGVLGTADGQLVPGGIAAQTTAAFANIAQALAARGLDLGDLVKCSVFLADINDFAAMNDAYKAALAPPRPARTTVSTGLVFGAAIEVECIANASP
jgi:lysine/arginine/ornithine transport system substrate-binding protein